MQTKEYRTVDKSSWPRGPWDDEPDKKQWTDEETGLPCLIVRGGGGNWCGYVGVPEGHPFFEKDYCDCSRAEKCESERWCEHSPDHAVSVHGGLTFANFCADTDDESRHICHSVEPGENDRVWWLGFDCAHCGDMRPKDSDGIFFRDLSYRDQEYVESEVRSLARQLKALMN